MSEHEIESLSAQAALLSVVEELERSVEVMTASLESMREAVRQVALRVREFEEPLETPQATVPLLSVVEPAAEPEYMATENGSSSWSPQVVVEIDAETADNAEMNVESDLLSDAVGAGIEPEHEVVAADLQAEPDAAAEEAAREEVRRAVEATRAQLSWSNLRVDAGFSTEPRHLANRELDESEPSTEARAEPEVVNPLSSDEEARREEVRLAVERARSDMAAANDAELAGEPAIDPEEARREEVRLAVERARSDVTDANSAEAPAEPAIDPEAARREEVRLAVERARAQMYAAEEAPAAVDDDEARREEVRRAVENHRGSGGWSDMKMDAGGWGQFKPEPGGFSIGPDQAPPRPIDPVGSEEPAYAEIEVPADSQAEPLSEEEARREEVRRTVEAARSEMVRGETPDRPTIVPIVPRPGSPPAKGSDFNGPPLIVIEDPLGRVELSQVFATLSRVDKSAQAALLNYSPHSVTIGLSMASVVPDPDQLVLAAQAVFGRVCSVKLEGNRTNIEIGTHAVGS